ncbi:HAD family hydrolase [Butyrivibrio sp. VCD2006]|uniref:HAD family hydrolase n=1 Tax=Butyrivibrio sp. VCD2006 TaxID=1280664 RepID=UPI0004275410|nr:HAD-IA family hydrolase [Butyrivibrio sp. VCD2006]
MIKRKLRFNSLRNAEFIWGNKRKRVPIKESESEQSRRKNKEVTVEAFVKKMRDYDVISFDVFDTLIFRPFAKPTDMFYLVGEKIGMQDFRSIRIRSELNARHKCKAKNGHTEIDLKDIWENLAENTGIDAADGMRIEWETELQLCYANPFMLEVWKKLTEMGKKIIIISDMYLSTEQIRNLIEKNGFKGADRIYVSSDYKKSKADGKLYKLVKMDLSKERGLLKILHVGDNPLSDVINAKKAGLDSLLYPNINRAERMYRTYDMSSIVGSAYRAIINANIYNGLKIRSMEYECGFIYGGLFVLGYCNFIHDYYVKEKLDKLLFLARKGDALFKSYKMHYPEDNAEYVYLSKRDSVQNFNNEQIAAAERYYWQTLNGCKKAAVVDVEWAGSGMEPLNRLINETSEIPCNLYEIIAGTNTLYHTESDASEVLVQSERLISYMYFQRQGRDILKKRYSAKGYSIFWELLLSSDAPQFVGFCENDHREGKDDIYVEEADITLKFGKRDVSLYGVAEIQQGIMDFVRIYTDYFGKYHHMMSISRRDAYAPIIAATSGNEKYLHVMEKKLEPKTNLV